VRKFKLPMTIMDDGSTRIYKSVAQ